MRKAGTLDDIDDAEIDAVPLRASPDLRGVPVDDATGIHVGKLYGALAEADTGLLRYLDLALTAVDRHVLVPIGHARVREIEPAGPQIRLRAALLEDLERVPPFPADVDHISDPFERAMLEAYGRTFHGERYYAHPAYDHAGVYAGEHPVIGPEPPRVAALNRMSNMLHWRFADDAADLRGWPLRLDSGEELVVVDVIIDAAAETVRYLMVCGPLPGPARLLPVGYVRIQEAAQSLGARGLTADDMMALPPYHGGAVTRADEEQLAQALRDRLTGRRRYLLPDYNR